MNEQLIIARARARSWWRRRRGKPDTLAQYARDLGFVTRAYTIDPSRGDVDTQIRAVCRDVTDQVFPPRPPRP